MRRTWVYLLAAATTAGLSFYAPAARAATVPFDLLGKAGTGLLPGNENGTITGGTGGEVGAGISFDDVTLVLTLNVGWGSGKGFTNLTGNTTGGHIHGPTASGGTAAWTQTAGILFPLDTTAGWDPSGTNGGYVGTVQMNATQAQQLMNGQFYFNVHTTANGGGEARGFLTPVPEPTGLAVFGLAGAALLRRRRGR
jgi:hypothetical protein